MLPTEQLSGIRSRLGMTQEQLARLLGVSFASVNRWEAGHSSPTGPTLDLYQALNAAIARAILRRPFAKLQTMSVELFSMRCFVWHTLEGRQDELSNSNLATTRCWWEW